MFLKFKINFFNQIFKIKATHQSVYFLVSILCVFVSCNRKLVYNTFEANSTIQKKVNLQSLADCNNPLQYIPDTLYEDFNHLYQININFHGVDYLDGRNNFSAEAMQPYFWLMTDNANFRLQKNEKMKLPKGNQTAVLDPKYKYNITPSLDIGNTTGQYHHLVEDKELAFFLNKGAGQNNYDTKIKSMAVHADSILNVFIMSYPPDKMERNADIYHGAGIALGSVVKLAGIFQKGGPEWAYATLLNHEIGHVFGLSHAWTSDGCDDTPNNANCFDDNNCKDGVSSNNLMDYNNSQMALTPCQIGRVRKIMSDEKTFQRKLLRHDWCVPKENLTLEVNDTLILKGARDFSGNIVVKSGAYLHLCCRVSMPEGSSITVEPGATLVLDNIKINNSCGLLWQGIKMGKKGKKVGQVIEIGKVQVDNVEP